MRASASAQVSIFFVSPHIVVSPGLLRPSPSPPGCVWYVWSMGRASDSVLADSHSPFVVSPPLGDDLRFCVSSMHLGGLACLLLPYILSAGLQCLWNIIQCMYVRSELASVPPQMLALFPAELLLSTKLHNGVSGVCTKMPELNNCMAVGLCKLHCALVKQSVLQIEWDRFIAPKKTHQLYLCGDRPP